MKRLNKKTIGWFLFAVVPFLLLGQFSISVGDDLGYMFADSSLHKGDGEMITNLYDCITTQANHYLSTNGRFLVHVATHFFTSIAGMAIFNVVNAIMFGLLMLLFVRFITSQQSKRNWYAYLLALFMLWVCVPAPGTVMLSLVAFAMNYMWTAVAYLAFLLLLKKSSNSNKTFKRDWAYYLMGGVGALVVGSLQESYGLPISAALFFMAVFNLKKIKSLTMTMIISFFVGCAICVFAPGNWCHAAQGGGFTVDSILRKSETLLGELSVSAIALLALLLLIFAVFNRKKTIRLIRENAFFLIAILVSLILAMLTFTSVRQLFCPTIFSLIVIGRIVMSWEQNAIFRSVSAVVMTCSLCVVFVGGYLLRKNTYEIHSKVLEQLGGKSKLIIVDATNANYNNENALIRLLSERYAPDPLANETLHLLFDGYTKCGLSRIGWENHSSKNINNFIPYSAKKISSQFNSQIENSTIRGASYIKVKAVTLDRKYKSVRVDNKMKNASKYKPYISEKGRRLVPYESFIYKNYRYFVLPALAPDTIVLKM